MAGGSGRERVLGDDEIVEQGAFVDINVTPLVDIFLVLLVILMATSTAILEAGQGAGSGYRVQLPSGASAEEVGNLGEEFVVAIPAQGAMIFISELAKFVILIKLLYRTQNPAVFVPTLGSHTARGAGRLRPQLNFVKPQRIDHAKELTQGVEHDDNRGTQRETRRVQGELLPINQEPQASDPDRQRARAKEPGLTRPGQRRRGWS